LFGKGTLERGGNAGKRVHDPNLNKAGRCWKGGKKNIEKKKLVN